MEKLGMKTKDISKEKFEILKELFPNAVTETTSENKMGGGAKIGFLELSTLML